MIKQYNGAKAQRRAARELLPEGGYIAKILDAQVQHFDYRNGDSADKLILSFDISEGIYTGFFKKDYNNNTNEDRKWRGVYRYLNIPKDDGSEHDGWAKNTFNQFIYAIEDSNPGYTWAWDETTLKGKSIGVLFRRFEWEKDGNAGWSTECCAVDAVSVIHEGKFKTPKDRPLKRSGSAATTTSTRTASNSFADLSADDGELPF